MDIIHEQADVVVVGAAGGGLTAALRAKENGAKRVVLLEKNKKPGGSTTLPFGMLAVESPAQKRLGLTETVDQIWLEHMNKADWNCDGKLVREWFKGSGKMIEWVESKGVIFNSVVPFSGDRSLCHTITGVNKTMGSILVAKLLEAVEQEGVELLCEMRAEKLLTDDSGAICGLQARKGDQLYQYDTKAVVLATGSISANEELVHRLCTGIDFTHTRIMAKIPHNSGDGFLMCEAIGGKTGMITPLFLGPNCHGENLHLGLVVRRPHLCTVNLNGERYTNEAIHATHRFGCIAGVTLQRQPKQLCFPIIDQDLLDFWMQEKTNVSSLEDGQGRQDGNDMMSGFKVGDDKKLNAKLSTTDWIQMLPEDYKKGVEGGFAVVAQTLDEVADFIGCDREALKAEVEKYNRFCDEGYDDDFLKDKEYLWPIRRAPFYCVRAKQGIDTCIGGITVDYKQRVISQADKPIEGLYAAGVCTSGFLGAGYAFPGSELGYTMYSGYAAGANAAHFIQQ